MPYKEQGCSTLRLTLGKAEKLDLNLFAVASNSSEQFPRMEVLYVEQRILRTRYRLFHLTDSKTTLNSYNSMSEL